MDFSNYQSQARQTAIYPTEAAIFYPSLGLAGEAGEQANKVKKILRDDKGVVTKEKKKEIGKEIGGVLWYAANLASDLGLNLDEIARENIEILNSRKERGVLQGSGDNR